MTERRKAKRARWGILGALVIAATLLTAPPATPPAAHAVDLPTWDDVQRAKANQAATDAKVKEIEQLIVSQKKELDRLRNLHSDKLEASRVAEQKLAEAASRAKTLEDAAAASKKEADRAKEQAAALVSQMYRSGGVDRNLELFLDSNKDTADALLGRLASMSKATERNTVISEQAEQSTNNADSLSKQAEAAKAERDRLAKEADVAEKAAASAVQNQGEVVRKQEAQIQVLETQLAALQDKTTKTVAGYQERLRQEAEAERKRVEAENRRLAEEERRRREQENNGGNNGGNPPVNPNPGGGGNNGSSNGWLIPVTGYYVSEGFRPPGRPDHTGIDLATAYGTPIRAAMSGTVAMAYWDGCGGNMVSINHPNGWQTRYAHMASWSLVGNGQYVQRGQTVGYVGSTGCSTGPHLHFEMRPNQDNGWYDFVNPANVINFN